MARSIGWRAKCPDEITRRMEQVSTSGFLVVQQPGPTCFVLKDPDTQRKFKVQIGTQHQCQCAEGKKDTCIHILFVLCKVFRIPHTNPLLWQRSFLEAEIDQLLRGRMVLIARRGAAARDPADKDKRKQNDDFVERRPIEEGDTCPICCDDVEEGSSKSLVYCRYGCGNNIHASCFKAYATHNSTNPQPLQCPLCRTKWGDIGGPYPDIKPANSINNTDRQVVDQGLNYGVSHGVSCSECRQVILGERYHCAFCTSFDLCANCFHNPLVHPQHPFDVSLGPGLVFQPATRPVRQTVNLGGGGGGGNAIRGDGLVIPGGDNRGGGTGTTTVDLADLQYRELNPEDYQRLLQLDEHNVRPSGQTLTETEVSNLRHLEYAPGETELDECPVCLGEFEAGDLLIGLPQCNHVFHATCIAKWLTESKGTCPVDGTEVPRMVPSSNDGGGGGGTAVARQSERRESRTRTVEASASTAARRRRQSNNRRPTNNAPAEPLSLEVNAVGIRSLGPSAQSSSGTPSSTPRSTPPEATGSARRTGGNVGGQRSTGNTTQPRGPGMMQWTSSIPSSTNMLDQHHQASRRAAGGVSHPARPPPSLTTQRNRQLPPAARRTPTPTEDNGPQRHPLLDGIGGSAGSPSTASNTHIDTHGQMSGVRTNGVVGAARSAGNSVTRRTGGANNGRGAQATGRGGATSTNQSGRALLHDAIRTRRNGTNTSPASADMSYRPTAGDLDSLFVGATVQDPSGAPRPSVVGGGAGDGVVMPLGGVPTLRTRPR